MRVRRGREVHRFAPGDAAPASSARHDGRPWQSALEARLIVLEPAAADDLGLAGDLRFGPPRVRDPRLARGFLALHSALDGPASALERETLLHAWLRALRGDAPAAPAAAARRDPALRRACELLGDEPARTSPSPSCARRPAWAAIA